MIYSDEYTLQRLIYFTWQPSSFSERRRTKQIFVPYLLNLAEVKVELVPTNSSIL